MTYELPFDDAYEPYHASSPTDRVILELQMYGHRPHQDEPDPRPLPDDEAVTVAGLLIHEAEAIPEVGQTFTFHRHDFEVLSRKGNQITRLLISPPAEAEDF